MSELKQGNLGVERGKGHETLKRRQKEDVSKEERERSRGIGK